MGRNSHHKISTGCVILIIICTLGLNVLLAKASTTASTTTTTTSTEKEDPDDLQKAESKDGKAEIIKQIQKVNNDGSYTVGYEADDGTFKIESRDVLGNVKGTFGYIDLNGEIKRVSYTGNNGTGLKNSPDSAEDPQESKYNRTIHSSSTTRRPSYSSTTAASVIQSIPRRLRVLSSSHSGVSTPERPYKETSTTPKSRDPTTTIVYATSVPTSKPYINIRPTALPGTNLRGQASEQQISRPDKLEIKHHVSQVQISTNREVSTAKPVVEEVDEKDEEKIVLRGNSLRRQLNSENDGPTTSRTLYPSNSKLPTLVLAARQRAAQIQNTLNSHTAISGKYYAKPPAKKIEEPTTESTSEYAYLTQQTPVQNQIPANTDTDGRILRKLEYRNPQFVRVHPARTSAPQLVRIPIPQQSSENEQYLRETTPIPIKSETAEQDPVPSHSPNYQRNQPPGPGFYYNNQPQDQMSGYNQPQDQMSGYYPQASPISYPYRPMPPPYYNGGGSYPERPLTTRDFERLLHLLVLRHQYLQRAHNPYLGGLGGYDPYYNGYQPNYPRPIYNPYEPRPYFRGSPYPLPPPDEGMYQAQSPVPQSDPESGYELQRLVPRKKQFNPRYFGAQIPPGYSPEDDYGSSANAPGASQNYLPSDVREQLLYRMLMLALQSEPQKSIITMPQEQESSTKPSILTLNRKPVRSVQILGEEN